MDIRKGRVARSLGPREVAAVVSLLMVGIVTVGCDRKPTGVSVSATPAAVVPNPPKENLLNTFELTAEAEVRLGVSATAVEKRALQRFRMYGGEITLPTGGSIVVSAPLAGFLQPASASPRTFVGETVRRGQPIFQLVPGVDEKQQSILSPVDRLNLEMARANLAQSRNDAEAQVEQTDESLKAAKIELDRAQRLESDGAGTVANLDRAKAAYALAQKSHAAALRRREIWNRIQLDEKTGYFRPLNIEAPQDGIIRVLHAVAGEGVSAGAVLFEVLNTQSVWVKVPVYAGEIGELRLDQPARLSSLDDRAGRTAQLAQPVSAPPTAQALASTVDLYYEVENRNGELRPGQKVNVNLPLNDEFESLVIPWSALVTDINGGTWVYESLGDHRFTRRRVQVKYVVDGTAVLANGPAVGTQVVSTGAAELFGTEFFVTK
ncbi:MAG: efflux RND transporter periplasmic adaptor subunit [Planctomycetes bacterium]|nr:efflux RND transporter periplasmic adaptor subunit [Planctomycetota bacterium]